ncbi:uncharacterized protein Z520_05001 [Fonsecaea multimorphosa CBS 102226]|uniref:Mediator of RNA polymerase II transcription subunit 11 n=1 Tax=Fonsecaea multimorphosa CBS 102226 TaxID=1442371 RepID=A0A0D2HC45_9EURO|nr:uncharacterized protein Z520_05001 [Fonsecaea multimorphosa CBS 102226]KIX99425.1 hypothetical protein Z520_05001 [Fonsecaea multimorphosa CBS 102226]OAL25753.1 hypothetical protein AYO22_04742 [Fonsecaea multimorphosa]
MEVDRPDEGKTTAFTPATRIAELNEIDRSISTLLSAASDAVGILSNSPTTEIQEAALRSSSSARAAFATAAESYFSTLSSIEVRLRRQVYALEEADLIRPGDDRDARKGRAMGGDNNLTRVGGGPLDPSWLNARASESVEAGMKQELLAQAKEFVENAEKEAQNADQDPIVKEEASG